MANNDTYWSVQQLNNHNLEINTNSTSIAFQPTSAAVTAGGVITSATSSHASGESGFSERGCSGLHTTWLHVVIRLILEGAFAS